VKVDWEDHTWPEIERLIARGAVAVVPVGATEQHGPHLPLRVDATLSTEVARRATERLVAAGRPAVLLPTVWTGYSPHHMDFPGTITLSAETFGRLLVDVAQSLHRHRVQRIVFVNGHGGNVSLLRATVQRLRFESGIEAAGVSYWDLALADIGRWRRSPIGGINHACEMETSLMLAVRPDLVDLSLAADVFPKRSPYVSADLTAGGMVTTAEPFAALTESGVLGAPTLADAARGAALLETLVAALEAFLIEFARWDEADAGG
jgi:creatinine amidohydrolase